MVCPASLRATIGLPDEPRYESAEGTVAHTLHEHCLREYDAQAVWPFLGRTVKQDGFDITIDEEMCTSVAESVEWCLEYPGVHYTEAQVDISRWTPLQNQYGKLDHRVWAPPMLGVSDFKYGKGIKVSAYRNPQLALYTLASLDELDTFSDITECFIRVSQPRLGHRDVWRVAVDELREFGEEIKAAFHEALSVDAVFNPSDESCRAGFCKLADQCPARAEQLMRLCRNEFESLDAPITKLGVVPERITFRETDRLTPEQLAWIQKHGKQIVDFVSKVNDVVLQQLLHDREVPGFKVTNGRGSRYWVDEAAAKRFMMEKRVQPSRVFNVKFASPNQAEQLLPKADRNDLAQFWRKTPGKPTVVPIDDDRPAYSVTPESLFGEPQ